MPGLKLVRSVNSFMRQRDSLTNKEWRRIRGVLRIARNDVLTRIRATPPERWQAWYLPRLRDGIETRMAQLGLDLGRDIQNAEGAMFDFTVDGTNGLVSAAGMEPPIGVVPREVLDASSSLSLELVKGFTGETASKLNNALALGVTAQEGTYVVARKIADLLDISMGRAERISRTEILRTQSMASHARYKQVSDLNPKARKAWIPSSKPKPRPGHQEAGAKYSAAPIGVDAWFKVRNRLTDPYVEMKFPRDPGAKGDTKEVVSNVVHCGCLHILTMEPLT